MNTVPVRPTGCAHKEHEMATKTAKMTPASEAAALKKLNNMLSDFRPTPGLLHPLQQVNKHKVPARKWKNWPDICQRVFNTTYDGMMIDQRLFLHPKAVPHTSEHWDTTAWNAAWTAADACQKALKDIVAGRGYAKA